MSVVEFLKEKERIFREQFKTVDIKGRLDPQLRNLSERFSETLANTMNNPWVGKINPFFEREPEAPRVISPEAQAFYNKWYQRLDEETYSGQWHVIGQECINQFAAVTGDEQWIHTNPERAQKESPFGCTIAHGFLTLALIPKLTDSVNLQNNPYPEARMLVNYGLNRVRFPSPVKANSSVRARTKLIDLIPAKRSVDVVSEVSVEINGSNRLACVAETVLRVYF
ncbi:MaoC family dehydratase [Marinagarivorans algicola]|uniref:MaoC family dehydratase n=1 Tax=Marinagarivorans algicola TaxID=1513270 RepID=UPI0006B650D6|nr:MaoC family dehydratase [Marinagarivorans algicola]